MADLDSPVRADSIDEPREAPRTLVDELRNIPRGFFASTVQRTWNGVAQVTGLPDMTLVDETTLRGAGAAIGNIAGTALDMYVIGRVGMSQLGTLGGAGIAGNALRMGTLGAIYEGLLQPSAPGTTSLLSDRLSSAAVGAFTWGTAGAVGSAINRAGIFAVPEARSFMGSLTYGFATGVPMGLAHAEAHAVFKDGRMFASGSEFLRDGGYIRCHRSNHGRNWLGLEQAER